MRFSDFVKIWNTDTEAFNESFPLKVATLISADFSEIMFYPLSEKTERLYHS